MVVAGKKVLVFGSGMSGIGQAKLLEENGADVVLDDGNEKLTAKQTVPKLRKEAKPGMIIGAFPEELPSTLDLVILLGAPILSDYFKDERKEIPVIGVVGTCIYIW